MSDREKLLHKIRALLAKTTENGCTEEEHLSALATAQAMMDTYEVSDAELNLTKEEKAVMFQEPEGSTDPHRIKSGLVMAIGKFCGCKAWKNRQGGFSFCGLRSDAEFAAWLTDHLTAFVQAQLVKHLATYIGASTRRQVIQGFVLGCTDRISQRLRELAENSRANAVGNGRALVVVKDRAISAKLAEAGVRLRSTRSVRQYGDAGSFAAGRAAGDRASFGRPVAGHGSGGVLRIGSRLN